MSESMQSHWLVLNKFPLQRLLYKCLWSGPGGFCPLFNHNLWRNVATAKLYVPSPGPLLGEAPLPRTLETETQICKQLISCYVKFKKFFTKLYTQKFSWRQFLNINTDLFHYYCNLKWSCNVSLANWVTMHLTIPSNKLYLNSKYLYKINYLSSKLRIIWDCKTQTGLNNFNCLYY